MLVKEVDLNKMFPISIRIKEVSYIITLTPCMPSRTMRPLRVPAHYSDVIMGAIASQITSLTIVYSAVYSDADQRKHQSSASLAFVRWIHRGPVNSPHKWPVTRKMFPFDDVIMWRQLYCKDILQIFCFHVVKVGDVKEQLQLVSPEDRFPADSKIRGANVGPTWGRQDPGGPHVGHNNLAIRVVSL